jgi:hypothetical protein
MGIFVSGKTQNILAKRLADWMFAQQQAKYPSEKLASQGNG